MVLSVEPCSRCVACLLPSPGTATLDPVRHADLSLIAQTQADLASGKAREARKAARVTQADLAEALGVSRQAVTGWESGQRVPSSAHALAYGRLLRQLARRAA
jgi:DNA-binding XRE family transcriptional regulator